MLVFAAASLSFTPVRPLGQVSARPSSAALSVGRRRTARVVWAQLSSPGEVVVDIATTGINRRCITASIVVNAGVEEVWKILTDYDNLATHVPNLVVSESRPPGPGGARRIYQEGAQNIVGFNFRASLTMDMKEVIDQGLSSRQVKFSLVESVMFASFDGEWRVQPYSRTRDRADPSRFRYKSKLVYRVDITPRGARLASEPSPAAEGLYGLVPIPAIEWRIREDVPSNLQGVKAPAFPASSSWLIAQAMR